MCWTETRDQRGGVNGRNQKPKNEPQKRPLSNLAKCRPLEGYTFSKPQRKSSPKSLPSKRHEKRRKRALSTLAEWVGQSGPEGRTVRSTQRAKTPKRANAQWTGQSGLFKMNGSDKSGTQATSARRTTMDRTVRSTGSDKETRNPRLG